MSLPRPPLDVLNYEIVEERATALGRMGRALETALARLRAFDGVPEDRRKLVADAGHALWMLVVQREACGLRDTRAVMRIYDVPGEVQMRMGPNAASLASSDRRRRRPPTAPAG